MIPSAAPASLSARAFGILIGVAAALKRNSWIDYLASTLSVLGPTIQVFVISMQLILIFAVWLNWLSAKGVGASPNAGSCRLPPMRQSRLPLMPATHAWRCSTRLTGRSLLRSRALARCGAGALADHLPATVAVYSRPSSMVGFTVFLLDKCHGTATGSIFAEAMFLKPGLGSYFVSPIEKPRIYLLEMAPVLMFTIDICFASPRFPISPTRGSTAHPSRSMTRIDHRHRNRRSRRPPTRALQQLPGPFA